MSIITRYSNQTVTLERRALDANGWPVLNEDFEPTYEAPEEIAARYDPESGLQRTATGDEVAVESPVLTATTIRLGDKVEGSPVRRIETIINKRGQTLGYRAFL